MTKTADLSASREPLSFEFALKELETIVKKLESGNVELEQAIEDYTRGMNLKDICEKKLQEAKLKVERVMASPSGIKTEPFEAEKA